MTKKKVKNKALVLKVAEAESKDVGRGIARVDPKIFSQIKADVGDAVLITSQRSLGQEGKNKEAVARIMPLYPEDRGKNIVQIDGIARENAKVGIGERINIQKILYQDADALILSPLSAGLEFQEEDGEYLAQILDGTPVLKGGKIRATFFGSKTQDFFVEDTHPEGAVLIKPFTKIKIKGAVRKDRRAVGTTYEDIGGLEREIQRIREMIELPLNKKLLELKVTMDNFREALKEVEPSALREVFTEIPNVKWEKVGGLEQVKQILKETIEWPLKHKEAFDCIKVAPHKGILLYGPPGWGKTLLAKAAASETGVNFISVKGPELLSKYIGESEKGVREVFKKAKQASPCIIFFDEIDSLVPKRGAASESHVIERVVSQFLSELDGIEELKGVIVLGATNRIDMIDPAFLRPGRFDFLLEIPKPDLLSRLEIFKIHTEGKPLDLDAELNYLAKQTEGCTGSDIELICKKAAICALRENLSKKQDYKKIKISFKHFNTALQ